MMLKYIILTTTTENTMAFTGKHTDETRAKMSARKRGVPKTEAHKAALREAHRKRSEMIALAKKMLAEQETK